MASDARSWTVTTHDWTESIDELHLNLIRDRLDVYGRGGIRHMVLEVLAYANDEANALGRRGVATVTLHDDGAVGISDDGRGTDTRRDDLGRVIRKPVMATRDVRFFDAEAPPLLPDGLPRRGMSTVAALSVWLVHENRRGHEGWSQTYRHGIPDGALQRLADPHSTGTTVTFKADALRSGPATLTDADLKAFDALTVLLNP